MRNTERDIIHGAVTRLLKPLARILLRHNVSFLTFSDLAKRVFVEVAEETFPPRGRKQSDSRIAMLTGLSRKEVLRVKRLPHPSDDEAMAQQERSTRVISGWTRDPRFMDAEGNPLPLHFDGQEGSFSDLVRRFSGDIPPRAVLDELLRVGLAERREDGRICLVARGYIPRTGSAEKLSILGVEASDLFNTIDHNIHDEGEPPYFQRKVCYYKFPGRYLPELRKLTQRRSQELLEELNRWMAKHDVMEQSEAVQGDVARRAGLSIYYFEGPPEEDGGENGGRMVMNATGSNIVRLLAGFALIAFLVVFLAACGNRGRTAADGGGGGIVGTGKEVVVRGEVTGFGSGVIVNGIEFARSSNLGLSDTPIVLAFENISTGREDALRTGMVVDVSGSYNTVSGKGSYTRIVFSPELRGPLDNGSVNASTGTCMVLGRKIQAGASTIFDGIADMNELALRQSQSLELEVSGYLDAEGKIQSSRIALKTAGFTNGPIQIKGAITDVGAGFFSFGSGVSVTTNGATFVNMIDKDLDPGLVVEVRGILTGSVVGSARIERKSTTSGTSTGETMRIKGVAAGPISDNKFVMAGPDGTLTVTTSGTDFLRGSNPADASIVVAGARLEVEGTVLADGSLAARKVKAENERTVRLAGDLTVANVSSNNLVLNNVTVRTDMGTFFRDNRKPQPLANLTLSELAPGDHLQVDGFLDGNGQVFASQVQRFDSTQIAILQGPVTSVDLAKESLIILGVTVTASSGANMSKGSTPYANFASFAAQVAPESSVVKAKGTIEGSIFSASSLEIEQ